MISAFNLLWIVPLFTFLGFVLGAIMAAGKRGDDF